jgi:O-methyltransferase
MNRVNRLWRALGRRYQYRPKIRYAIDAWAPTEVSGWAVHESGIREVRVLADGGLLGRATLGLERSDVHAAHSRMGGSLHSGFLFAAGHGLLGGTRTDLAVEIVANDGTVARQVFTDVPCLKPEPLAGPPTPACGRPVRSGFPADVTRLLHRYRPGVYDPETAWTDEQMARAVVDLTTIWNSRARVPVLNRYVLFLKSMLHRFDLIRSRFPRFNGRVDAAAKDVVCVATQPREMLSIANQLYVLKSNGLDGHFLEFGCFKGYSSCCLSHCCHELGIPMEVFDSFAGLPPSDHAYYHQGDFCGSMEEVAGHVAEFGRPQVVSFHKGYFAETVRKFDKGPVLCVWMDVDLPESARDVAAIFDRLPRESAVFTHESTPAVFASGRVDPAHSQVFPPIVKKFESLQRPIVGRHLCDWLGAVWDRDAGIPVVPNSCLMTLAKLD